MLDYFLMNGYAIYVWGSYFFTILVLGLIWFISDRFLANTKKRLKEMNFSYQINERKELDET